MFIWTIGDIAAVIIFVIFIVAAVVERIDSAIYAKPHKAEPKVEPKPEPKPQAKEVPPNSSDKVAWFLAAMFFVAALIALITLKK